MRNFIWSPQIYEEFYLIFTEIWGTHLMKICTQTECYFDIILKRRTIIMIVSHCSTPFKVIFGGEGNAIQLIWQTLLSSSHFSSSALLILTINMMSRAKKWISTSFRETRFCRRLFFFFFREVNSFPHCQLLAACPKNCLERDLDKNPLYSYTSRWQRHWGYWCFVNLGANVQFWWSQQCAHCIFGKHTQAPGWIKSNCIGELKWM